MAKKPTASSTTRSVPVSQFEAQCHALVNSVRHGKGEIILTSHGRPIAMVIPLEATDRIPFVGSAKGFFKVAEGHDLVAPMALDSQWGDDI